MSLIIGIDASRNRSGGAKAYLIGVLSSLDLEQHGIGEVHVWVFQSLLDSIPDFPWLVKHNTPALEQSLLKQLWWQAIHLSQEARIAGCDILFTTDASTLCRLKPMVVLSQDMLSYEPGAMSQFRWGYARLRLLVILYLQNAVFRRAQGVIFLTRYASKVIQDSCSLLRQVTIIPHGVGEAFLNSSLLRDFAIADESIRCLYVSPISRYKHQWTVVRAIELLRKRGFFLQLDLVGGEDGSGTEKLDRQIAISDPAGSFVRRLGAIPQCELPTHLASADLFVFASSCENMPVTLLEAMAVGLPIACSDRGPMPEVLEDGGVYFDPENPESIATAIEKVITDTELRTRISVRARKIVAQYSWKRCAKETFAFIAETYHLKNGHKS